MNAVNRRGIPRYGNAVGLVRSALSPVNDYLLRSDFPRSHPDERTTLVGVGCVGIDIGIFGEFVVGVCRNFKVYGCRIVTCVLPVVTVCKRFGSSNRSAESAEPIGNVRTRSFVAVYRKICGKRSREGYALIRIVELERRCAVVVPADAGEIVKRLVDYIIERVSLCVERPFVGVCRRKRYGNGVLACVVGSSRSAVVAVPVHFPGIEHRCSRSHQPRRTFRCRGKQRASYPVRRRRFVHLPYRRK